MDKIISHVRVHALNSYFPSAGHSSMRWWTQHTHLLLYTEVRCLSKGGPLAEFLLCGAISEIYIRKTIITVCTFQTKNGSYYLLTCVMHSTCSTNSIYQSRENDSHVQVGRQRSLIQSQRVLMGANKSEHYDFFTMFQTLVDLRFIN